MTDKTHVSIRHINKVYGDGTHALRDICLDVREGEILVLLGSSGCGKSTLLRTIGGLEKKTSGEIYFYDQEISSVPVEKRNVGFVFQNYALFPTMTVRQNIAFGLKLRKLPREQIEQKVQQLLDMMDLNPYAGKKPGQLSGGQQQRVAIARALAIEPKVLLMDEPLTALDAKLKEYLRIQLGKQLRQFGITTIYVTHDQLEAMALADRIAIMNGGIIEQVDTPAAIYSRPQTDFVAQFIGKINQLPGTVHKRGDQTVVDTGFVHLPYRGNREYREGDPVKVYLRLEDMALAAPAARGEGVIPAKVTQCIFMGACCQVGARIGESEVYFEAPNTVTLAPGDSIAIQIDEDKMIVV